MICTLDTNDVLVTIDQIMRKNGISDTIDIFSHQVFEMIVNQTDPELDLDSIVEVHQDDMKRCLALQEHVRCGNASTRDEIRGIAQSIHDSDRFEWLTWLVSAIEQLSLPIDEKQHAITNEIHRLDQLCYDAEQCLASIANKPVRKARRANLEIRKVRGGLLTFVQFL
jgi:hypothetical protein